MISLACQTSSQETTTAASVETYDDDDGVGDDVDTPTVLTTDISEPILAPKKKVVDLDTIYDPPLTSK